MAFSNTYDITNPGSATGNREQISDKVRLLEPESTPVYSLATKSKATATNPEYVADTLADPDATPIVEGADPASYDDKFEKRAKIPCRVQTFERTWMVSKQQQAVKSVGPADFAKAKAKSFLELKRDVELALCSDNDAQAEDGQGNGGRLRGLGDWIDESGPSDVPADYRSVSGSTSTQGTSLTQDQLNTILESRFAASGEVDDLVLVAGHALRRAIANYMRTDNDSNENVFNVNIDGKSKEIPLSVKIFDSDFGYLKITHGNPACMPATDRGYILDTRYLECLELIPMGEKAVPDNGGGPRGLVDCALTLGVFPRAHGKIT